MRFFKMVGIGLVCVASALALAGCDSANKAERDASPVLTGASATVAPPAPGEIYETDSEAHKAPPAGSALDKVLKGLHLRVCVRADVPPFSSFSGRDLEGMDIDLASEIAKQISIDYKHTLKVDWTVVTAAERIKRLNDDACDVLVATLSYTAERAKEVTMSKVYVKTDKVLMASKKITRKEPVIAKLAGATGGDPGGDIKGTDRLFNSYTDIVYAMDNDEIDYLVTDKPIADHLVRSASKPYSVTKTLAPGAESYVIATRNGVPELSAAVNKALEELASSGRLAFIHRRWL